MESYLETHYNHHQNPEPEPESEQQQKNSGLLRYRSAPSSLFFDYTHNLNDFGDNGYSESYERKPERLSNSSCGIGYSGSAHTGQLLPPQYPKQSGFINLSSSSTTCTSTSMEKSIEIGGDGGGGGGGFNLNRQSSSPAGFFSQLNPQNGYTILRGVGSFRVANGTNGESSPRSGRLGMNHLPRIPEVQNETVKETSPDEVKFRHREGDPGFDSPAGYSFASWNGSVSDASHLPENGGLLNRPKMLTHHLSLPKTSTEMAAIEKLLHFQDTVPCKVSAKRGFATHPRSIAERERRNRISERMRKLQDLVPNMDKQTNTADMLDLAVDYIKDLQEEFKVLSNDRAKCKCVNLL